MIDTPPPISQKIEAAPELMCGAQGVCRPGHSAGFAGAAGHLAWPAALGDRICLVDDRQPTVNSIRDADQDLPLAASRKKCSRCASSCKCLTHEQITQTRKFTGKPTPYGAPTGCVAESPPSAGSTGGPDRRPPHRQIPELRPLFIEGVDMPAVPRLGWRVGNRQLHAPARQMRPKHPRDGQRAKQGG